MMTVRAARSSRKLSEFAPLLAIIAATTLAGSACSDDKSKGKIGSDGGKSDGATRDGSVATDGATPDGAVGSLDGRWRLDSKTCNGVAVDLSQAPTTDFIIAGGTGRFVNSYCEVQVALTYPAAGQVEWVISGHNCGGTTGVGDKHSATYTRSGDTLTLTEDLTPASEFGCPSGKQISTLTLQPS